MLFYKHKNSFILSVRTRAPRTTTMTSFWREIYAIWGILSPYARVRTVTSLPCVRTQRHLHAQKTADVILAGNLPQMGGGGGNTTYVGQFHEWVGQCP